MKTVLDFYIFPVNSLEQCDIKEVEEGWGPWVDGVNDVKDVLQ